MLFLAMIQSNAGKRTKRRYKDPTSHGRVTFPSCLLSLVHIPLLSLLRLELGERASERESDIIPQALRDRKTIGVAEIRTISPPYSRRRRTKGGGKERRSKVGAHLRLGQTSEELAVRCGIERDREAEYSCGEGRKELY